MPKGWKPVSWGQVSELRYGKAVPKTCNCESHSVPVMGTSGVFGWTCKPLATGPKVIVGRKGTLGVQLAKGDFWTVDTAFWLEESDALDPYWAYYRLRAIDFKNENSGSAVPSLTRDHFYAMRFDLPPIEEQLRISGVLSEMDGLIEVNRRLISDIVHLSRSLYRQAITRGTTETNVDSIATFENKKRVPLSAAERLANPGSYPYYGATGAMDSVGGYLFDGVRVLVGEDGSVVRADGSPFVQFVDGRFWVNNHAHVLVGRGISTELLRIVLESANVSSVVTGAVQMKLSMGNLKSVRVQVPTDPRIDEAIRALALTELGLREENRQLETARDAMLPLLMSGRLRVGDVAA